MIKCSLITGNYQLNHYSLETHQDKVFSYVFHCIQSSTEWLSSWEALLCGSKLTFIILCCTIYVLQSCFLDHQAINLNTIQEYFAKPVFYSCSLPTRCWHSGTVRSEEGGELRLPTASDVTWHQRHQQWHQGTCHNVTHTLCLYSGWNVMFRTVQWVSEWVDC